MSVGWSRASEDLLGDSDRHDRARLSIGAWLDNGGIWAWGSTAGNRACWRAGRR